MLPAVRFGKTDLMTTRLALGGYPFGGVNLARGWDPFSPAGRAQAIETIHTALDAGITLVDTAPGYGGGNSESIVGAMTRSCWRPRSGTRDGCQGMGERGGVAAPAAGRSLAAP